MVEERRLKPARESQKSNYVGIDLVKFRGRRDEKALAGLADWLARRRDQLNIGGIAPT